MNQAKSIHSVGGCRVIDHQVMSELTRACHFYKRHVFVFLRWLLHYSCFFSNFRTQVFFNSGKNHITLNLLSQSFLSIQFISVKYIHTVVQQISRTFFSCKTSSMPIKHEFLPLPSPWHIPMSLSSFWTTSLRYDWHEKVYICNVYSNLVSLEVSIHSWNHYHIQAHKHHLTSKSFLPPLYYLFIYE